MGFFNKKRDLESLDDVDKKVNKGMTGAFIKAFVPKETRDVMNQGIQQAKDAQAAQHIPVAAVGTVVNIKDTGKLINHDPVVVLELHINNDSMQSYTIETIVSKLQIPRVGDVIKLGNHPTIEKEYIYMGISI